MDKQKLIHEIIRGLAEELNVLVQSAKAAHEAATHEESRQEDLHDTRRVEASYLAGAQAARVAELHRLITVFKFFPVRQYGPKDPACPGALVELDCNETRAYYFVVPQGGGLVTRIEGKPVQIITPQSPIGDALMGRKAGERIDVETRSGARQYTIVSIS